VLETIKVCTQGRMTWSNKINKQVALDKTGCAFFWELLPPPYTYNEVRGQFVRGSAIETKFHPLKRYQIVIGNKTPPKAIR
jgi:hypothetical protein